MVNQRRKKFCKLVVWAVNPEFLYEQADILTCVVPVYEVIYLLLREMR